MDKLAKRNTSKVSLSKTLSTMVLCTLCTLGLTGCSTTKAHNSSVNTANNSFNPDPFEKFNRKVYAFNTVVDKAIIRPIAKTYDFVMPSPVKKGVSNFFSNLDEVPTIANDLLQANFSQMCIDTGRFVINSTIGIGGLFDLAARMDLEKNHDDFGITLAKWGARKSPYLVLPILGPSTIRDTVSLPVNAEMSVITHIDDNDTRLALQGTQLISTRAQLLQGDQVIDEAFDPYVLVRDAYLQRRHYLTTHTTEDIGNSPTP
jgi:phospholipid-binding lipoprotein MlaA